MPPNTDTRPAGGPTVGLAFAADHIDRARQSLGRFMNGDNDRALLGATVDGLVAALRTLGDHAPVTLTIVDHARGMDPVRVEADGAR